MAKESNRPTFPQERDKALDMALGQIEILDLEAEAIYVPADWEGPVVALPLDETVF